MAGWLLNVGRPSEVAAEGEEVGEVSSVAGEGIDVAGFVCGVAVGVVRGTGVLAGDGKGVPVDEGVGEFADCSPNGSADLCPQAMTRKLARASGTIKRIFMPLNTDARVGMLFKARYTNGNYQAKCMK